VVLWVPKVSNLIRKSSQKLKNGKDPGEKCQEDEDNNQPFSDRPGNLPDNPSSIRMAAMTMKIIPRVKSQLAIQGMSS
jgi:hypothetical protein